MKGRKRARYRGESMREQRKEPSGNAYFNKNKLFVHVTVDQ